MFRYPGAKTKVASTIIDCLAGWLKETKEYHEPFVGGGSVGIGVAEKFPDVKIYFNDLNENMFSFWKLIESGTEEEILQLFELLETKPTVELFAQLRNSKPETLIDRAYRAIFFNRCTFSGIENSGPIGGINQESKWKIDCRYNSSKLKTRILYLKNLFQLRLSVSNLDILEYLRLNGSGCCYLDPPYYVKGKQLYSCYMTAEQHLALLNVLFYRDKWILSYDNCPEILELYKHCFIYPLDVRYCINGEKTNWNETRELLIFR